MKKGTILLATLVTIGLFTGIASAQVSQVVDSISDGENSFQRIFDKETGTVIYLETASAEMTAVRVGPGIVKTSLKPIDIPLGKGRRYVRRIVDELNMVVIYRYCPPAQIAHFALRQPVVGCIMTSVSIGEPKTK